MKNPDIPESEMSGFWVSDQSAIISPMMPHVLMRCFPFKAAEVQYVFSL